MSKQFFILSFFFLSFCLQAMAHWSSWSTNKKNAVDQFINKNHNDESFISKCSNKDIKIFAKSYLPPVGAQSNGTIVLLTGYGESHLLFAETIYDLSQSLHYKVLAMDHRGMGQSSRFEEVKAGLVHVDHFSCYVEDFKILFEKVETEMPIILSHSTGGLIALSAFIHDPDLKNKISSAIFVSPLMESKELLDPVKRFQADHMSGMVNLKKKVWGMSAPSLENFPFAGQPNNFDSHDVDRWKQRIEFFRDFNVFQNAATNGWGIETYNEAKRIIALLKNDRDKFFKSMPPFLILLADNDGKLHDGYVLKEGQNLICITNDPCIKKIFNGPSLHHLLIEKDYFENQNELRVGVIKEIENFLIQK